jgi:hypothetical protein
MRREVHWEKKREDKTSYEVRVGFFGKKFKFQYKESTADRWDYDRDPTEEDLLMLLDIIKRRYQRRQAGPNELEEAERLLREFKLKQ